MNRGRAFRGVAIVLAVTTNAVLMPTAINIGTGGTPPGFLAPFVEWTWPAIGVLWGIVIAAGLWEWSSQRTSVTHRPIDHPRNRPNALARVTKTVSGRFGQSLAAEARIELDIEVRPDVVRPAELTVQPVNDGAEQVVPSNIALIQAFDMFQGSMLILGNPGAGKSTLLVELARDLVERARKDPQEPVPVLVDLAGWSESGHRRGMRSNAQRKPVEFRRWLRDELRRRYTFPHHVSDRWLTEGRLTLLLDGLDELHPDHRGQCVEELNELLRQIGPLQIVVCSREAEYTGLREVLHLAGAVGIKPLTRARLNDYFRRSGSRLHRVKQVLDSDPELWELLDSPLMLNVLAIVTRSDDVSRLQGAEPLTRRELFDAYVCDMLARRSKLPSRYSPRQTVRVLWFSANVARTSYIEDRALAARFPSRFFWSGCLPLDVALLATAVYVPVASVVFSAITLGAVTMFTGWLPGVLVACGAAIAARRVVLLLRISTESPIRHVGASAVRAAVFGALLGAGVLGVITAVAWFLDGASQLVVAIVAGGVGAVCVGCNVWRRVFRPGVTTLASLLGGVVCHFVAQWWNLSGDFLTAFLLGVAATGSAWLILPSVYSMWLSDAAKSQPRDALFTGPAAGTVQWGALLALAFGFVAGAPFAQHVVAVLAGMVVGNFLATAFELKPMLATPIGVSCLRLTGHLPRRKREFLAYATDRGLLKRSHDGWRFVHLLVRDHLADCDPDQLGQRAERRVAKSTEMA
ncbi:NACHT domain-containing protein [Saccharomonospora xinjiangensis]|uniref:NACHT domain-containing protein n=1 Tax=Saccharomonospora xinjiangensis TaxID=75294 RepID=UPI00350ED05B